MKLKGILLNSFLKASITLIPKLEKYPSKKVNLRPILLIRIDIKS